MRLLIGAAAVVGAGCGGGARSAAEVPTHPIAIVVSANAEWKAVRARFPDAAIEASPYGAWFLRAFPEGTSAEPVVMFHGGYGKVSAAGSTQYLIDRFHPRLIVNVGTCGGFGADVRVGDVLLVNETIIYDILEQMGDADEAIADYTTKLDVTRWPLRLRGRVRVDRMVSGDRDLVPSELPRLRDRYKAVAGDWESGSIAWVGAKNHTPVLILRGVTDLVTAGGNVTYGNIDAYQTSANEVMSDLFALLGDALPELAAAPK